MYEIALAPPPRQLTTREGMKGAQVVQMDVTDQAAVQAVAAAQPRLDILVNNAGIGHVGGVMDVQPEDFDRLMKVNVYSIYYVTQAFLPLLLASHGSIVMIGSVAGMVGIKGRFAYIFLCAPAILLTFYNALAAAATSQQEALAQPGYKVGDRIPVSCLNRTMCVESPGHCFAEELLAEREKENRPHSTDIVSHLVCLQNILVGLN